METTSRCCLPVGVLNVAIDCSLVGDVASPTSSGERAALSSIAPAEGGVEVRLVAGDGGRQQRAVGDEAGLRHVELRERLDRAPVLERGVPAVREVAAGRGVHPGERRREVEAGTSETGCRVRHQRQRRRRRRAPRRFRRDTSAGRRARTRRSPWRRSRPATASPSTPASRRRAPARPSAIRPGAPPAARAASRSRQRLPSRPARRCSARCSRSHRSRSSSGPSRRRVRPRRGGRRRACPSGSRS